MAESVARLNGEASSQQRYRAVRDATVKLAEPLSAEDCQVQSMPDVSPVKWHLAHVTWFFETFLVLPNLCGAEPFDESFQYLFNSYYNSVGGQFPRPCRGLITRPSLDRVMDYRLCVDERVGELLGERVGAQALKVLEVGLNHEQQHQELLLMDIKHVLSRNPQWPAYRAPATGVRGDAPPLRWQAFEEGLREIGHDGEGFAFDNETPRHREYVHAFELASRPVTNREYLAFMEDGGYRDPLLWLSDGWDELHERDWSAPLYWERRDGQWWEFTLGGLLPLDLEAPVCHLSYYEADAYARWAGARLPTEAEWEVAAAEAPLEGNFVESGRLHPVAAPAGEGPRQMFGDVWEWTASAYAPYPAYRAPAGALGEYNGKFMCNQQVMRGGCCVTPRSHIRSSYRNFFYPRMRWQFGGIRLAR